MRKRWNKRTGRTRLIVYDLDGTLVDTKEDIAASTNHMLGTLGAPLLSKEEICHYVGLGLRQLVEDCLKTDDAAKVDEGVKIYRRYYTQHLLDHTKLYPFAQEVLNHFKTRKQMVVTNKPNPYSRQILEALGVAQYFIEIIAGDVPYPKKPDPTGILAIMNQHAITPQEVLLVGDSPIDVETARAAGIATIGVTHGFVPEEELRASRPDWMVGDLQQLLSLAQAQNW